MSVKTKIADHILLIYVNYETGILFFYCFYNLLEEWTEKVKYSAWYNIY